MIFKIASVDSLTINFGNEISKEIASDVQKAYLSLKNLNIEGIIEIIPSYTTIYISYDVFKYDYSSLCKLLENNIDLNYEDNSIKNIINIDVYYGKEVGLDLEDMSVKKNLSIEEIIQIHTQKEYDVYAIGFAPGFGFLASVDERIALPRLSSPRKSVPKGSVAIADKQTAVYPQSSPGGWNIIGRTAMELFDKSLKELSPLSVGSKVKFNSISKEEFLAQGGIL
ncbi:5-oxoprolinase subunit PxpB [Arcobacter peruensis]|uniref:5-oxoprolinase subunit PxpB n=1 Tax=Arcobacter peruensis TaxID=2320140 RepID=UPI000F07CC14|nr:5-oxoprolinase subunit PxpB [Arcobacter peruensis]